MSSNISNTSNITSLVIFGFGACIGYVIGAVWGDNGDRCIRHKSEIIDKSFVHNLHEVELDILIQNWNALYRDIPYMQYFRNTPTLEYLRSKQANLDNNIAEKCTNENQESSEIQPDPICKETQESLDVSQCQLNPVEIQQNQELDKSDYHPIMMIQHQTQD